jgi:hypothetical protein
MEPDWVRAVTFTVDIVVVAEITCVLEARPVEPVYALVVRIVPPTFQVQVTSRLGTPLPLASLAMLVTRTTWPGTRVASLTIVLKPADPVARRGEIVHDRVAVALASRTVAVATARRRTSLGVVPTPAVRYW